MDIVVEGLDDLEANIDRILANIGNVRQTVRWAGSRVQQEAMKTVPVDTGELKRSIGLHLEDGGLTAVVEATKEYAGYVEYGTRFMAAQPYMRPAAEQIAPLFVRQIQEALGD